MSYYLLEKPCSHPCVKHALPAKSISTDIYFEASCVILEAASQVRPIEHGRVGELRPLALTMHHCTMVRRSKDDGEREKAFGHLWPVFY